MVIWFIGISGAGKTTLGKKLKAYLDSRKKKAYLIDGDIVRDFFDNDLGYSKKERVENIKRIILSAHVLDSNGVTAIVCNIAPFEFLRQFCRKKIKGYNQIYCRRNVALAAKKDVKKVYEKHRGRTAIVGIDMKYEEPRSSDLVLDIDNESKEESFAKVVKYLRGKYPKEFK